MITVTFYVDFENMSMYKKKKFELLMDYARLALELHGGTFKIHIIDGLDKVTLKFGDVISYESFKAETYIKDWMKYMTEPEICTTGTV